jgi:hypothetical protein
MVRKAKMLIMYHVKYLYFTKSYIVVPAVLDRNIKTAGTLWFILFN